MVMMMMMMVVVVMMMIMRMPVLSNIFLLIIAYISLYLTLEISTLFAVLNVKITPSNFLGFTLVSVSCEVII